VEALMEAIDGLALVPFVGAQGRTATGTAKQRHDDLTLVFRDEVTVERFRGYVASAESEALVRIETAPASQKWRLVEATVAALRDEFGHDAVEYLGDWWWAPCPLHGPELGAFRLRRDPAFDDGRLEVQCAAGCSPYSLLAVLGDVGQRVAA
jgi:hypothetical protein